MKTIHTDDAMSIVQVAARWNGYWDLAERASMARVSGVSLPLSADDMLDLVTDALPRWIAACRMYPDSHTMADAAQALFTMLTGKVTL